MTASPIRYSPDVEHEQADEADVVRQLNEAFDVILERTAEDYGHAVRSVHAKAHGVLKGEFVIDDGLPPELAQGAFAMPGTHQALLRISTNAGDILRDGISLPRGLAIKVLDVAGERLPGADGTAQDFVTNNGKVFVAKDAKTFLGNVKMLAKTTDRMEGTKEVLSTALRGVHNALEAVGLSSPTVDTLGGTPNADPLGETYNSVTPYRWGDYIAKYRLVPIAPDQVALTGRIVEAADPPMRSARTSGSRWNALMQSGSSRSSFAAILRNSRSRIRPSNGTRRFRLSSASPSCAYRRRIAGIQHWFARSTRRHASASGRGSPRISHSAI